MIPIKNKISVLLTVVMLLLLGSTYNAYSQCDYIDEITVGISGSTNDLNHQIEYILVDPVTNNILAHNNTGAFVPPVVPGNYDLYAINYNVTSVNPITDILVGSNAGTLLALCGQVTPAVNVDVCESDGSVCEGQSLLIGLSAGSYDITQEQLYVLTDASGNIVATSQDGVFPSLPVGTYYAHTVQYTLADAVAVNTATTLAGIEAAVTCGGTSPGTSGGITTIPMVVNPACVVSITAPSNICQSENGLLPYTISSGSPNVYSIDYDAVANTAGLSDVTSVAITSSPITLNTAAIATGTYNATITFTNSTSGCSTAALPFSITIGNCCIADAGLLLDIADFCEGTVSGFFAESPIYPSPTVDPILDPSVGSNYQYVWVLVNSSGNILSVNNTDGFFNTAGLNAGNYCVYGLSYKDDPADPFDAINYSSGSIFGLTDMGGNQAPWSGGTACIDATTKCFNVLSGCAGILSAIADPCVCMNNGNLDGTNGQFETSIAITGGVAPYTLTFSAGTVYAYNLSNAINTPITLTSVPGEADGISNFIVKFDSGVFYDLTISDAAGNTYVLTGLGGCNTPTINNYQDSICNTVTSVNLNTYNGFYTLSSGAILGGTWLDNSFNPIANPNSVDPNAGPYYYQVASTFGCSPTGTLNLPIKNCGSTTTTATVGSVGSYIFYDADFDGYFDQPEPFTDLDGDGYWDAGEPFVDSNGDGVYNGPAELYTDTNNNGQWDPGEPFFDANGDGVYTNGTTDFGVPGQVVYVYSNVGPDGIPGTADDNDPVGTATTNADGSWSVSGLPIYDANGNIINYFVQFPTVITIGPYNFPLTVPNIFGPFVGDEGDSDANSDGTSSWFNLATGSMANVSAGFGIQPTIVVSIHLTTFEANADCDKTTLSWTAADETDVSHYLVQRSFDGYNWITVQNIAALGYSNASYNVNELYTAYTTTYYRIASVNTVGVYSYSVLRQVISNCEESIQLVNLFPNPVNGESNLFYTILSTYATQAHVEVIDMNGRVIISDDIAINPGSQQHQLNTQNLAQAAYTLGVTFSNGDRKFLKFAKVQ